MTPEEVVREFCAAVSKRDEGVLRPLLADDAIYQNVGMEASRGIEAVIENVAGQWAMFPEAYEFDMVNLAVSGSVVLTERIDRVGVGGGVPVGARACDGTVRNPEREDHCLVRLFRHRARREDAVRRIGRRPHAILNHARTDAMKERGLRSP